MWEGELLTVVLRPRFNLFEILVLIIGLTMITSGYMFVGFLAVFLGGLMSGVGRRYILDQDEEDN